MNILLTKDLITGKHELAIFYDRKEKPSEIDFIKINEKIAKNIIKEYNLILNENNGIYENSTH